MSYEKKFVEEDVVAIITDEEFPFDIRAIWGSKKVVLFDVSD